MNPLLLDVKNLSVEYRTGSRLVPAVRQVSFSIRKGEIVALAGESGSGKTSVGLSVMNLLPSPEGKIANGEIYFHENENPPVNLLSLSSKQIRQFRGSRIGMIFQEPGMALNPVLSCGYQITESIIAHKRNSKKEAGLQAMQLFQKVHLPQPHRIYYSFPHQLSGGQKQRVMIAMAIACHPSLLIADEPASALDATVQSGIIELLKILQQQTGMSILLITHDLDLVSKIADHVLIMHRGEIVEQGMMKDVFKNPAHPYTKALLACRPVRGRDLKKLPVVNDFFRMNEKGEMVDSEISVNEILKRNSVSPGEKKLLNMELYKKEPILKVEALEKSFEVKKSVFGKTLKFIHAVDNISFDVFAGETLGLVGESGCGKTTLARTVLKLADPKSGRIFFNGNDISVINNRTMRKLRKDMQIIFQDPYSSLNPRIRIGKALMEPMKVHHLYATEDEQKSKAKELLLKVGLEENHFYHYPHEFSGGQRQRICIARALAVQPQFIVCDEAVSSLDVSVQAQILNLLNDLKNDFGLSYIFISHNLNVVKFMSDRMMVMHEGKIVESGNPDEIYYKPKSEYTKRLIESLPAPGN